jgi:hypothetical protein
MGPGGRADSMATSTGSELPATTPRKIIYNSEVELTVEQLSSAEQDLERLAKAHKGYVAETDVSGAPGSPRSGRWKIRVPVEEFQAFMAAVIKVGEVQRIHTDSQDVSEEYYDLEARLVTKRVEETRLIGHLAHSTGKLQEILAVERELSRVRGEIEQMQGRLRKLSFLADLATITVTAHDVKGYVPPKPTTFASQISRTFHDSVDLLRDFGQGLVLYVVALVPWLLVAGALSIPALILIRRYRASRAPTGTE